MKWHQISHGIHHALRVCKNVTSVGANNSRSDREDAMSIRVLVVEDNPDILRLERRILQREGYEVTAALDGDQALAGIDHEPPDLIVTNLTSLRRHGRALRDRMAATGGAPPALLVSGATDEGPPGLPYLRQPFGSADFLHAVARALGAARP